MNATIPPNLLEALKYGLSGLVAIIAILSFLLLQSQQKKEKADRGFLSAVKHFATLNVILAIIVTLSSFAETIIKRGDTKEAKNTINQKEAKISELQTELQNAKTDLALANNSLQFIRELGRAGESDKQIINRLRDDFSKINELTVKVARLEPLEQDHKKIEASLTHMMVDLARLDGAIDVHAPELTGSSSSNLVARIKAAFKELTESKSKEQSLARELSDSKLKEQDLSAKLQAVARESRELTQKNDSLVSKESILNGDLKTERDAKRNLAALNEEKSNRITELEQKVNALEKQSSETVAVEIDEMKNGDYAVFAAILVDGNPVGVVSNFGKIPRRLNVQVSQGRHSIRANFTIHGYTPPVAYGMPNPLNSVPFIERNERVQLNVPNQRSIYIGVNGSFATLSAD